MRLTIVLAFLALASAGCMRSALKVEVGVQATPSATPDANEPHIPGSLLPNHGGTSARKAGFGAAGAFVR